MEDMYALKTLSMQFWLQGITVLQEHLSYQTALDSV